jgi:hypothetical protein
VGGLAVGAGAAALVSNSSKQTAADLSAAVPAPSAAAAPIQSSFVGVPLQPNEQLAMQQNSGSYGSAQSFDGSSVASIVSSVAPLLGSLGSSGQGGGFNPTGTSDQGGGLSVGGSNQGGAPEMSAGDAQVTASQNSGRDVNVSSPRSSVPNLRSNAQPAPTAQSYGSAAPSAQAVAPTVVAPAPSAVDVKRWQQVAMAQTSTNVGVSTYIDQTSIANANNIHSINVMRSTDQPVSIDGVTIQSTVTRMEFSCAENKVRQAKIDYYTDPMAAGAKQKTLDALEADFTALPAGLDIPEGMFEPWFQANYQNVRRKVCG